MKRIVVAAVKALMCKKLIIFWILLLASSLALAAEAIAAPSLKGGINTTELYQCEQALREACGKKISVNCLIANSAKLDYCKQARTLIEYSNSFPNVVENYENIDVVRIIVLAEKPYFNYIMVGGSGELVLANPNVNLENAPGFLDLKQKYPNAILTNQILDFPQAVFLTANIQKLMVFQKIIDPIDEKNVGYAKILYSFTSDGVYQGSAAMRIITTPYNL